MKPGTFVTDSRSELPDGSEAIGQPKEWTEASIRQLLSDHEFKYQKVSLPFGLSTSGTDRSPTAKLIFPEDMTGKSLFDVGCMYGYFGFEAERRGANRIVGGEIDPNDVTKCRLLASAKGSAAKFLVWDIERDDVPGTYDYVLCLNVLHHLRNPLSALDKLIAATRERLILEVASFSGRDSQKFGPASALVSALIRRLPMLFLGGAGKTKSATQTFFITETAIQTLLLKHRRDFARVETKQGGQKGRYVIIAHKRQIEHLYIFAGVNNVGKTTLIDSFGRGENTDIAASIGFDRTKPWSFRHYSEIDQDTEAKTEYMALQYNISKHLIDGDLHQHQRGLLDLVKCAERVTIVTLWAPRETLRQRFQEEQMNSAAPKSKRAAKKVQRLEKLFGNASEYKHVYADWLGFATNNARDNHVILQEPRYRVTTIDAWLRDGGPQ